MMQTDYGLPARAPERFAFDEAHAARAERIRAKYPRDWSDAAVLPLLELAQKQQGWLPRVAMDHVADWLGVPRIRVYEVATFYSMFHLAPVGRYLIEVCTSTPCWLCGSDDILRAIADELGIAPGQSTEDGGFTCLEVECLGACVNAPMIAVNGRYYEDLDYDRLVGILRRLKAGEAPEPGPQIDRQRSAPTGGPTVLRDAVAAAGEAAETGAGAAEAGHPDGEG